MRETAFAGSGCANPRASRAFSMIVCYREGGPTDLKTGKPFLRGFHVMQHTKNLVNSRYRALLRGFHAKRSTRSMSSRQAAQFCGKPQGEELVPLVGHVKHVEKDRLGMGRKNIADSQGLKAARRRDD
jgi:hypothetical protein